MGYLFEVIQFYLKEIIKSCKLINCLLAYLLRVIFERNN